MKTKNKRNKNRHSIPLSAFSTNYQRSKASKRQRKMSNRPENRGPNITNWGGINPCTR